MSWTQRCRDGGTDVRRTDPSGVASERPNDCGLIWSSTSMVSSVGITCGKDTKAGRETHDRWRDESEEEEGRDSPPLDLGWDSLKHLAQRLTNGPEKQSQASAWFFSSWALKKSDSRRNPLSGTVDVLPATLDEPLQLPPLPLQFPPLAIRHEHLALLKLVPRRLARKRGWREDLDRELVVDDVVDRA